MYFIYSLLLAFGFLILIPRFVYDAFKHGKYVTGFGERLGGVPTLPPSPPGREAGDEGLIWIHCVSVGEAQAARPLVLELKKQFPRHRLAISTTTVTGQTLAREVFKDTAQTIFYFPFDWRHTVRRTLNALRPEAVLIMETELWPSFLRECEGRQIPVALLNGRISERSFRRYRLFKGFMSKVLGGIKLAVMQSEDDATRLQALGIEPQKVHVSGSLKFDAGTQPLNEELIGYLRRRFDFATTPIILAASTHAPEERILIDAFQRLIANDPSAARLLIAPRHPERFKEVASLIAGSRLSWARRTAAEVAADKSASIVLLDTIGELQSAYPLATVVFVGGSIAKTGGQNLLEPAAVGACIVTGAHTYNFKDIVDTFNREQAIIQLTAMPDSEAVSALASSFADLLVDAKRRQVLGDRARRLVNENRGATARTVELLKELLANSNTSTANRRVNQEHPGT